MSSTQAISDYYHSTIEKVETFLEDLTILITDKLLLINDPSITTIQSSSNDNNNNNNNYNISIVAEWFHSIPHVDIKLRSLPANITFDPNDNEYLESLGILVAIPGFWLILTLIFFLIFFLCRCCDGSNNGSNNSEQQKLQQNHQHQHSSTSFHQQQSSTLLTSKTPKPRKLTGCKFCLAFFALIATIIIVLSLLGSIMVHRGMIKLHNSTADIADVLETVQNDTRTAAYYLHDEIDVNIESLKGAVEKMLVKDVSVKGSLETQLFFLKRNVSRCMRRVDDIYSRIERLNIRPIPDNVQLIEKIRWPGTFAFAFLLILFCFILLCGLCRHSRCTLIMFSVFGLLALVLGWVLSSLYLGILVAGSDFCAEPDSFLDDRFSNEAEMAILDYYIRCRLPQQQQQHQQQYDRNNYNNYNQQQQQQNQQQNNPTFVNHPFRVQTRASLMALDHMSELIRALEMLCISYCSPDQSVVRPQINSIVQHLNSTERLLKSVQQLLDCRRIHDDYIQSMSASCKDLIEGFFLLLITSALIGLIFTLLVLCASHTWIHIRTKQPNNTNQTNLINTQVGLSGGSSSLLGQLDNADETDPFLPSTPRNPHQQQQQSAHHHTILSNNSTSSSLTNTSLTAKRFRDSYGSAYGTTGRGRFSHTPPQTPHFTTLGGGNNMMTTNLNQQQQQQLIAAGRRSEEQLSFLSPPPAYDQLNQQQQQQLHYQQQLQQQQQAQQQQHSIYGGSLHHHHTGTLPHSHHHLQQQQQQLHHPTASIGHHHQQPQQHHQSAIGHYVADPTDIMIRAPTQATKF